MVATLVKTIKPRKLQIEKTRQRILKTLEDEGWGIAREFDKTTASWEGEKPKFEILVDISGSDAIVIVRPAGSDKAVNKWVWADQGTPPHKIKAKRKPRLIYREGYAPKTKVGTLASFPGGSFGEYRSWPEVQHPGTEARGWSELVMKRRRKRFQENMVKAARVEYK